MKIEKTNRLIAQYNFLKLTYKKKSFDSGTEFIATQVLLNKIANIIHNYHISKKKILFVGFPKELTDILQKTEHAQIPTVFLNSISDNSVNQNNTKTPKKISQLILSLKKKTDLIIIYNSNLKLDTLKKSYLYKTPILIISKKFQIYKISEAPMSKKDYNFSVERIENINYFYSLIQIIMNKNY